MDFVTARCQIAVETTIEDAFAMSKVGVGQIFLGRPRMLLFVGRRT